MSDNQKNNQSQKNSDQPKFPQFGNIGGSAFDNDLKKRIAESKSNGWGSQLSGFFAERKKTLLIGLVALLLFAGGTFLSRDNGASDSQDNTADISSSTDSENSNTEESGDSPELTLDDSGNIVIEEVGPQMNEEAQASESAPVMQEQERTVEKSEDSITISAKRGDGVTHLARNAMQEYLNQTGQTLTPEQAVYAEDYARRRIGSHPLEIGDKLSFSEDLLKEATSKSQALEDWQIENLKKYTR